MTSLIENVKGKLLTEDTAIHKRGAENWTELYKYKLKTDASILNSEDDMENRETGDSPIIKAEVERAVRMLKDGKSPGVGSIPAEILKHVGPGIIDTLTALCQKTWNSWQWPKD